MVRPTSHSAELAAAVASRRLAPARLISQTTHGVSPIACRLLDVSWYRVCIVAPGLRPPLPSPPLALHAVSACTFMSMLVRPNPRACICRHPDWARSTPSTTELDNACFSSGVLSILPQWPRLIDLYVPSLPHVVQRAWTPGPALASPCLDPSARHFTPPGLPYPTRAYTSLCRTGPAHLFCLWSLSVDAPKRPFPGQTVTTGI